MRFYVIGDGSCHVHVKKGPERQKSSWGDLNVMYNRRVSQKAMVREFKEVSFCFSKSESAITMTRKRVRCHSKSR